MPHSASSGPEAEVIALTLYSQYKIEAFSAVVDAFLIKGCAIEALIDVILSLSQFGSEDL